MSVAAGPWGRLGLLCLAALWAAGCAGVSGLGPEAQPGTLTPARPWRGPAARLAERGFSAAELESVFNSPDLVYSSAPMAAKLRELYGLNFRSELTREIQEKLFQLGYDLTIDGQAGSGTRAVVSAFQKARGLAVTGVVSRETLAQIDRALKGQTPRPLAEYRPPPPPSPSRSATHAQFTNPQALAQISDFYRADRGIFDGMSRRCGVPGEVAAAIIWIETGYGRNFGRNKAAAMLASMAAASSDFSVVAPEVADLNQDRESLIFLRKMAVERGDWALNELAALLRYAFDNGHDPVAFPGSIYGAIGWGQFMPSNVLKYGADGDGDGRVDLFNKVDAVYSVGNFLRAHGWAGPQLSEEARRAVIMKYNRSAVYVNTVLFVADHLARAGR
ncbi:MAG: lytic murein transglycosylase [Candidatus Adiutrix sp.]|jgi:membrane-bound lytic murein transglycosylase B|nr:lytic murein transglycosylase [Candidatus Adiutrix sp.]